MLFCLYAGVITLEKLPKKNLKMRHNLHYILKDKQPVPEPFMIAWAQWMEIKENRIIKKSFIFRGQIEVSTVFLGIDHGTWSDQPVLFETMVFGIPDEEGEIMERYTTYEQAKKGHYKMIEDVVERLILWSFNKKFLVKDIEEYMK